MESHPNIGGDSHDILNSDVRDRLVKLAISQLVGLCWAAPPCRHYSLCKLTGPGPPPCRDFQNLQGFDTMRAKLEAQESFNKPENNSRKNLSARRAGCSFDGKLHALGVSDACESLRVSSCSWLSVINFR